MRGISIFLVLAVILLAFCATFDGQSTTAQLNGKILDKAGQPLAGAQVILTNLDTAGAYKFKSDKNGQFSGGGIQFGEYLVEVISSVGEALYKQKWSIASDPATSRLDLDLSKPPVPLSKAQVDAIEAQIPKLKAQGTQAEVSRLQNLIAQHPEYWSLYLDLGNFYQSEGKYEVAVQTYEKGIQQMGDRDWRRSDMFKKEGDAYLALHKNKEAVAAYLRAADLAGNPAKAYLDVCSHQYEIHNVEGTLACDKAIATDLNKADTHFFKGSLLVEGSKQDAQGKVIAPPGSTEALKKYLELAPHGPYARPAKQMLQRLGVDADAAEKALVTQAQNAMSTNNWQEAISLLWKLVAMDSSRWEYHAALGDALLKAGQYQEAVQTYSTGIQAAIHPTDDDPDPKASLEKRNGGIAKMQTNGGTALLKLGKNKEAIAAFTNAAQIDPHPATAYFNLCATQYNLGDAEAALAACDKALAADPDKGDAYFIKGSLLIAKSKQDPQGKLIAPPGTAEALKKYLELAPDGAHASDAKQMLQYLGAKP